MTTTTQNTVFSPAVARPERCETGKELMRAWAKAMNEAAHAAEGTWLDVWGRGYMPYAMHSKECVMCTNYNFSLTAPTVEEK